MVSVLVSVSVIICVRVIVSFRVSVTSLSVSVSLSTFLCAFLGTGSASIVRHMLMHFDAEAKPVSISSSMSVFLRVFGDLPLSSESSLRLLARRFGL